MMNVFMVHSECGKWSEWTYGVEGVFSTYDYAKEYIESKTMMIHRHVGKYYGDGKRVHYDRWDTEESSYENDYRYYYEDSVIDKQVIFPTSTDGKTFRYVFPDGNVADDWEDAYFIDEYEVDCAN